MSSRQVIVQDYSAATKKVLAGRLMYLIEALAVTLRDEVVDTIRQSTPAGRQYKVPGTDTYYTASAPGQAPADRLSQYLGSIQNTPAVQEGKEVVAFAFTAETVGQNNEHLLGDILEHGTQNGNIEPRPHWKPAIVAAVPKMKALIAKASKL